MLAALCSFPSKSEVLIAMVAGSNLLLPFTFDKELLCVSKGTSYRHSPIPCLVDTELAPFFSLRTAFKDDSGSRAHYVVS